MTASEVLQEIESKGKPNTVKIYRRHGVTGPTVGLSFADLGGLTKRIKTNHALAQELWNSGLYDARILATKVADPAQMTKATLTAWLDDCSSYLLTDAVADLAARTPGVLPMALGWLKSRGEWVAAAGWIVIAMLARKGDVDDAQAMELLARIQSSIHTAPNRTRYSMNGALIALGGYLPNVRPQALATAKAIGEVDVDHGETGCTTPDASATIAKVAAHQARRPTAKSVTIATSGTRAKSPAPATSADPGTRRAATARKSAQNATR